MQPLSIPGLFTWSVWQPDRNVFFNSYFIGRDDGNIVVDPLAWTPQDEAEMRERGGVAWIIITNRDHERRSRDLAALFAAKIAASERDAPLLSGPVDRILREGDKVFPGIAIIELEGLKSPGEIALHLLRHKTTIVGDSLWGDPAGRVRLLPDEKLLDPKKAVLSLRKLWALQLDALLVGDGACIFHGADAVIGEYLQSRTDVYVNRINIDEAPAETSDDTSAKGVRFAADDKEIGLLHRRAQARLSRVDVASRVKLLSDAFARPRGGDVLRAGRHADDPHPAGRRRVPARRLHLFPDRRGRHASIGKRVRCAVHRAARRQLRAYRRGLPLSGFRESDDRLGRR